MIKSTAAMGTTVAYTPDHVEGRTEFFGAPVLHSTQPLQILNIATKFSPPTPSVECMANLGVVQTGLPALPAPDPLPNSLYGVGMLWSVGGRAPRGNETRRAIPNTPLYCELVDTTSKLFPRKLQSRLSGHNCLLFCPTSPPTRTSTPPHLHPTTPLHPQLTPTLPPPPHPHFTRISPLPPSLCTTLRSLLPTRTYPPPHDE